MRMTEFNSKIAFQVLILDSQIESFWQGEQANHLLLAMSFLFSVLIHLGKIINMYFDLVGVFSETYLDSVKIFSEAYLNLVETFSLYILTLSEHSLFL